MISIQLFFMITLLAREIGTLQTVQIIFTTFVISYLTYKVYPTLLTINIPKTKLITMENGQISNIPNEGMMAHTNGQIYPDCMATFSMWWWHVVRIYKDGENCGDDDGYYDGLVAGIKLDGNGSLVVFTVDAFMNHCHSFRDRNFEEVLNMDEINDNNNDSTKCCHINKNIIQSILVERTSSKYLNAKDLSEVYAKLNTTRFLFLQFINSHSCVQLEYV